MKPDTWIGLLYADEMRTDPEVILFDNEAAAREWMFDHPERRDAFKAIWWEDDAIEAQA
jgi:hypothetical protein